MLAVLPGRGHFTQRGFAARIHYAASIAEYMKAILTLNLLDQTETHAIAAAVRQTEAAGRTAAVPVLAPPVTAPQRFEPALAAYSRSASVGRRYLSVSSVAFSLRINA